MKPRNCASCGAAQDAENLFCPRCGSAVADRVETPPAGSPHRPSPLPVATKAETPEWEAMVKQLRLAEGSLATENRRRGMRNLYGCLTAVVVACFLIWVLGRLGCAGRG